jgi:hypothetical protein
VIGRKGKKIEFEVSAEYPFFKEEMQKVAENINDLTLLVQFVKYKS